MEVRKGGTERLHGRLPVARTSDGNVADVSDFPSGTNEGHGNFSKSTYTRYRGVVNDFIQSQDVSDLMDVTPREISKYFQLMQQRDYARTTIDNNLESLGVFFKWAESEWRAPQGSDAISDTIDQKRSNLDVSGGEKSRAGKDQHRISTERAQRILGHLAKHDYASRQMVEFLLVFHIGLRKSGLLSINCSDVKPQKQIIQIRNRPEETGVRLKRGNAGERDVNVASRVIAVITDYIEEHRTAPKDGSEALLTSWAGRVNESTVYRDFTDLTKCGDCTDEEGSPLTKQQSPNCPESIGCHDLRRVAITRMRDEGVSWETISGRVNATVPMLKSHYDSPTHEQAAERRAAEILNAI